MAGLDHMGALRGIQSDEGTNSNFIAVGEEYAKVNIFTLDRPHFLSYSESMKRDYLRETIKITKIRVRTDRYKFRLEDQWPRYLWHEQDG